MLCAGIRRYILSQITEWAGAAERIAAGLSGGLWERAIICFKNNRAMFKWIWLCVSCVYHYDIMIVI